VVDHARPSQVPIVIPFIVYQIKQSSNVARGNMLERQCDDLLLLCSFLPLDF
jgi:hypothetical protein